MAWTIAGLVFCLFACRADLEQDKLTDTATGETGQTPSLTGDTGTPPIDVWPLCDHIGRTEPITLLGADRLDAAGSSIDASDIDGDGCAEVAVASPWVGYYQAGEGGVYLVTLDGLVSGPIDQEAAATWQEPDATGWVYAVALVPPQITWLTAWSERDTQGELTVFKALAYELPDAPLPEDIGGSERTGDIYNPGGYHNAADDIEDCSGLGTSTLCVGSASLGPEADFAGSITLYDMPLDVSASLLDFRTRISGNTGERAAMLEADHDLDGDGLADLVIGAYYADAGTGRVGLVSAPAEGDFLLWDITYATFEGVVEEGYTGGGLATGDLDGDGHVDVWVGTHFPLGAVGRADVMAGPFTGSQPISEALVTVEGEDPHQFVGVDGAIGDMTGDGAAELIVGAPYSPYFNTMPGSVAVFSSPPAGTYTLGDAQFQLVSGSPEPDNFGYAIAPADFDGDGLLDLAIGAPEDSRSRELAGSVTLVFGASL